VKRLLPGQVHLPPDLFQLKRVAARTRPGPTPASGRSPKLARSHATAADDRHFAGRQATRWVERLHAASQIASAGPHTVWSAALSHMPSLLTDVAVRGAPLVKGRASRCETPHRSSQRGQRSRIERCGDPRSRMLAPKNQATSRDAGARGSARRSNNKAGVAVRASAPSVTRAAQLGRSWTR
jgi:hypothetical protein